ncbi:MAG: hypothetical protein KDA72_11340, partial [Planctomycetales bacterium]|nr:hypothetical protein [Planctomycetales bacterium]
MSFAKPLFVLLSAVAWPLVGLAGHPQGGNSSRLATFQDAGNYYFALSVQADPAGDYPLASAYEVVVLVDTSATQTGPVRLESLEVARELARSLPAGASVALLACDIETVDLSDGLIHPSEGEWDAAMARLKKRVPLGTTDLAGALRAAAAQFSDRVAQRTVVYIGDGVNRSNLLTKSQHRQLVDELIAAKVTVSSLAIGPIVDLASLAAIANQTGGIMLSRDEIQESTQAIGHHLALSTTLPVIWVSDTPLPTALSSHFPQRFPPLRVDRDTVVVGESAAPIEVDSLTLAGSTAAQSAVELSWKLTPEASNPDLGFLTAVVAEARRDGGVSLPALGSSGLRAMSYMLADNATAMVKAGQFALKSGDLESAQRIAKEALKQDPNNAEAAALLEAAKRVAESQSATVPAGKFTQTAAGTAGNVVPQDPAAAPALDSPQRQSPPPTPSLLDDTLNAGDLLSDQLARDRARAQAIETEVRQSIRNASERMRLDPSSATEVVLGLKLLLERIDNFTDTEPALRAQLRSLVSSELEVAASNEARFNERVSQSEAIRAQADQATRLLREINRNDEGLKQLVEQFNFLMAEQRYLEASKDVAPV